MCLNKACSTVVLFTIVGEVAGKWELFLGIDNAFGGLINGTGGPKLFKINGSTKLDVRVVYKL